MTTRLLAPSEIDKADRYEGAARVARMISGALEAGRDLSPEQAARATRRRRARIAGYALGGASATGATLGLAQSVGNRIGPARKVKLVNPPERRKKEPASKGFITRDPYSSPGASITTREPGARFRTGRLKGQARASMEPRNPMPTFVARDENSSPGVTRLRPRTPTGQFVSHTNDLKVFHPQRYGSSHRVPRDRSDVQRYTPGGDDVSRAWKVGKALGTGAMPRPMGLSSKPLAQTALAGRIKPLTPKPVRTTPRIGAMGAARGRRL